MGSREQVMAALHDASNRFIRLAASVTPADGQAAVPRLEWNVSETIAHVLTVVRRGYHRPSRSRTAAETASLNGVCLDELKERDPAALAELLLIDDEPPISFEINNGRLVIGPAAEAIDVDTVGVVVSATPLDMVLNFYGRLPTADPVLLQLLSRFVPS